MPRLLGLVVLAGCRFGFDPIAANDALAGSEGDVTGDGMLGDGSGSDAAQTIACADTTIGSALGPNVLSGTTSGQGDDYNGCSGDAADLAVAWVAPATASYRIDLCASPSGYDSVLSVRNGSCTGNELACDDDSCGGIGPSRLTVSLTAGQPVVIVIDGDFSGDTGTYQLAIQQL